MYWRRKNIIEKKMKARNKCRKKKKINARKKKKKDRKKEGNVMQKEK